MFNWVRRIFEKRTVSGHPSNPPYWLVDMFGGRPASSGVRVNEHTAMSWTALSAGIRFRAESMASMPLEVMRRRKDGGREAAREVGLYGLLHDQPNPEMTSFEWRELSQTHMDLWGNAYSQIVWSARGEPIELWPLNPDRVQLKRNDRGSLYYQVSIPSDDLSVTRSQFRALPPDEILHIRGPSRYGFIGEGIAKVHPEAIGLGLATEEFAARFFGSGMTPSGILQHPAQLSEEAQNRLRKSLENQSGGLSRAHRMMILEEGMQWQQTTIEPEKAQFLGLREFQVQEASRILRVPPHLLYDLSRATFSNIEHQGIEVVTYTLLPVVTRWEQRLNMQLISTNMKNTLYTRFNLDGFRRGDTTSRTAYFTAGRNGGWLSANDIRELEDMNPIPDGDSYLQPANMVPLGTEPPPVDIPKQLPNPGGPDVQQAA